MNIPEASRWSVRLMREMEKRQDLAGLNMKHGTKSPYLPETLVFSHLLHLHFTSGSQLQPLRYHKSSIYARIPTTAQDISGKDQALALRFTCPQTQLD
jgi:hypothetical protein